MARQIRRWVLEYAVKDLVEKIPGCSLGNVLVQYDEDHKDGLFTLNLPPGLSLEEFKEKMNTFLDSSHKKEERSSVNLETSAPAPAAEDKRGKRKRVSPNSVADLPPATESGKSSKTKH